MTISRKATILYSFLLVASGGILGAVTQRLYTVSSVNAAPKPDEWRKKYVSEMESRVKLSPDQLLKLNIYLDETRSRVREAQAKAKPEIEQIKREQRDKIRSMLSDGQRAEYEKLIIERDKRSEQEAQKEREQRSVPEKKTNGPGL